MVYQCSVRVYIYRPLLWHLWARDLAEVAFALAPRLRIPQLCKYANPKDRAMAAACDAKEDAVRGVGEQLSCGQAAGVAFPQCRGSGSSMAPDQVVQALCKALDAEPRHQLRVSASSEGLSMFIPASGQALDFVEQIAFSLRWEVGGGGAWGE